MGESERKKIRNEVTDWYMADVSEEGIATYMAFTAKPNIVRPGEPWTADDVAKVLGKGVEFGR